MGLGVRRGIEAGRGGWGKSLGVGVGVEWRTGLGMGNWGGGIREILASLFQGKTNATNMARTKMTFRTSHTHFCILRFLEVWLPGTVLTT